MTQITENRVKYAVHTFVCDDSSKFVVPDARAGVPTEYLVVGCGGTAGSARTRSAAV
jgi:hypothetical protein